MRTMSTSSRATIRGTPRAGLATWHQRLDPHGRARLLARAAEAVRRRDRHRDGRSATMTIAVTLLDACAEAHDLTAAELRLLMDDPIDQALEVVAALALDTSRAELDRQLRHPGDS